MSDLTEPSLPLSAVIVEQDSPQHHTPKTVRTPAKIDSEIDAEIQKLKDANQALQLRVLGVGELARLLQDRNEMVNVLQEKNKRLEVAVVRLENRCSNFERKMKSQGGVTVGPRPGQSPFIPGPSRQILEALMKENSELKKTLNNVTKRGASGYLEAVVSYLFYIFLHLSSPSLVSIFPYPPQRSPLSPLPQFTVGNVGAYILPYLA